jgi:hypothetical protein
MRNYVQRYGKDEKSKKKMIRFEEIDENVVAVAMYKMREVPGVNKVEKIILPEPPTLYPVIGFDPMANSGTVLEINGIRTFLPYLEAKDMCHPTLGQQITENFVKKVLER